MLETIKDILALARTRFSRQSARVESVHDWNRSAAGITVTENSAHSISAVFLASRAIAEDIAGLPWRVYRENLDGTTEVLPQHPITRMLNDNPNPDMDAAAFRSLLVSNAMLWGDGLAEIERDRGGRPVALWPIHPQNACLVKDKDTGELVWIVQVGDDGQQVLIPRTDMYQVMGQSPDGKRGWSVVSLAKHTMGLMLAAESFGSEFFANGAHLSGVLTNPTKLGDKARADLRRAWQQMHVGQGRRHRVGILDGGTAWQPLGVPPGDAQFLETRKFQIEEVARWFRIPPHKLMDLGNATYSNITNMERAYVQDALVPWMTRLEQQANNKLFGQLRLKTNIDATQLLRGNPTERAQYYETMWRIGAYSINDIRQQEGMNGIGTEGDTRLVQKQYVPLSSVVNGETLDKPEMTDGQEDSGNQDEGAENRRIVTLQ